MASPVPGQTYATSAAGTLFAARVPAGIDFNVWFDPAGSSPARLVFDKTSLPRTNLALGAAFGRGNTVYILVQRAFTHDKTDQEVYAINRVSGQRQRIFRVSELGLLLALGERFEYQPSRDVLIFSAARTQRASNGQVGQVNHLYQYGPLHSTSRQLRQLK